MLFNFVNVSGIFYKLVRSEDLEERALELEFT
jgi:hypothetical protein